jgi:hypothetical protein
MIMKKIYLYILVCVLVGYSCDDMNDFEQGILKGYVLDAVTGEGLADVDVVLEPVVAANGSVTSKSDGHFNLSRLVAGTYSVNVRKNGASIIDNAQDEITITDGCVLNKEYKLTPRISVFDFNVDYDKNDPTKFVVHFKARGNQGNKFNYYSVMWNEYPNFIFADLPNTQRKAVKHATSEEAEVTYEVSGLDLKEERHIISV